VLEAARSAEELAEEVEGVVVMAAAATAALLVLLEAFVAVLVVDAAGFGLDEGFVRGSDFDESLGGGVVAAGVGVPALAMG